MPFVYFYHDPKGWVRISRQEYRDMKRLAQDELRDLRLAFLYENKQDHNERKKVELAHVYGYGKLTNERCPHCGNPMLFRNDQLTCVICKGLESFETKTLSGSIDPETGGLVVEEKKKKKATAHLKGEWIVLIDDENLEEVYSIRNLPFGGGWAHMRGWAQRNGYEVYRDGKKIV